MAIAHGAELDHRLALLQPEMGWLAIADLHYGFESHRRKQGALLPDWGMARTEELLRALIADHAPQQLILIGDIMDGRGSLDETLALLERLRALVPEVVPLRGNHDNAGRFQTTPFPALHTHGRFLFHHGHEPQSIRDWLDAHPPPAQEGWIHLCGHQHPAHRWRDGAGLNLKMPALVQEALTDPSDPLTHPHSAERWVLPAFSPWSAGSPLRSDHKRIGTWACLPGTVLHVPLTAP